MPDTPHQPDGGPATMTPAELLALHDKFMSGGGVTDDEKAAADHIALSAAFGSAAYEAAMDADRGTHAMLRAFLLALVDPMHPDLDYLRRNPEAALAAREGGAA
ncbi:hypothetical protein [Paracoccus sp. (in: a-proteobacteria)]|uniref:hypothetical protein n=1 Tax=Paracoccus sp. TaxID=267 RepID=UPI00333EEAE5